MKHTRLFLGIAAGLIVSLGVHTARAQEIKQYTSLKDAISGMSEDLQSCQDQVDGQNEDIASLEARLKSMTDYAASLQQQLQQADDDYAACLRDKNKPHDDGKNRTICNVITSLFGAPQQNTLCEIIGRTN
ncbi:MAG TPA: hypothetical protein VLJ37_02135 [bacterium]|nr:hypothetical protein [bacterium]